MTKEILLGDGQGPTYGKFACAMMFFLYLGILSLIAWIQNSSESSENDCLTHRRAQHTDDVSFEDRQLDAHLTSLAALEHSMRR